MAMKSYRIYGAGVNELRGIDVAIVTFGAPISLATLVRSCAYHRPSRGVDGIQHRVYTQIARHRLRAAAFGFFLYDEDLDFSLLLGRARGIIEAHADVCAPGGALLETEYANA
jgi:hypothetical protein